MSNKVIILGAGAHAAEIVGYIEDNNLTSEEKIEILGFYADKVEQEDKYKYNTPILGGLFEFEPEENISVIIGFANVELKNKVVEHYKSKGANFFTFIHKSSFVFKTAVIGEGNVICRNCVIGPNVILEDFNLLNSNVSVGHDSQIGSYNVICPNVGFSGNTIVGNSNFFSINAATIPNVKIGNHNIIAPNMVIEKNIKDESTVFHRFKEKIIAIPK
ncbi:acetyltransferase [Aureivirga marina]|uniref:acetyltransferase n=1 Tax=Aureivirga marina TaxID=1182451 RepID=UPI0018CA9E38|nr:acetyltransferase [Aureivirga marina]